MNEKEFKSIEMEVKFSNFKVLNPDFTRCRCNVCYSGRNRNHSDITPNSLQKLILRKGYANIPVVGHIRKPNVMGAHDEKIEITDEGIDIINERLAYGVVPEDCNAGFDKIIDIHGIEKEYFSVDLILWTSYFPEIMETIGDPEVFFSQSMEIKILDSRYDGDYLVIDDFSLQALCLLGKYTDDRRNESSEPCFEDSVVRRFSIDEEKFKQNFELMLEKLKSYESDVKPVQDINNFKEGDSTKTMNREKIVEALSNVTYENALGVAVGRYALVSLDDATVGVIDRTDNKTYTVNYLQTDDGIVFNFDEAKECSLTTKEKEDTDFDYAFEISVAVDCAVKAKEAEIETKYQKNIATELEKFKAQITEATDEYAKLKAQYDVEHVELEKYKAADEKRIADKHNADVEARFEKAAQKMGRVKEFLFYRADPKNREKSLEEIDADLMMIMGKAMMNQKQEFSYEPTVSGVQGIKISDNMNNNSRYGNLLSKFTQD